MVMTDLKALIASSWFFQSLPPKSRNRLAEITLPKSLEKGDTLFLEGDKGYALYLCGRGSIGLWKRRPSGDVSIKTIKSGELFAEAILFEKDRYPVTAVALEKSLVYLIPKHQFLCLLEDESFRNPFIANLMEKLRYLAERIETISSEDAETRFLRFIRERSGGAKEIRIQMKKKDIAAAIGVTPETLSRLVGRLKVEGRLEWKDGVIRMVK
jgi:CRP/FNR family transcriptional regulator